LGLFFLLLQLKFFEFKIVSLDQRVIELNYLILFN
jgi:hypothetical protein